MTRRQVLNLKILDQIWASQPLFLFYVRHLQYEIHWMLGEGIYRTV